MLLKNPLTKLSDEVLAIIILLLLLNFIPFPYRYLFIFAILSLLLNWFLRDYKKSMCLSLIIVITMYLLNYSNISYEYFDNEETKPETEAEDEAETEGSTEQLNSMKQEDETISKEKRNIQDSASKSIIDSIKSDGKKLDNSEKKNLNNIQKELFDTTKQMNEAMTNLSPLLKQAANIRKQFMDLGLVK
jgi:hypothetical protein